MRYLDIPRYIKINEKDNVAIVVNDEGMKKGTILANMLELQDNVPFGHKFALKDLKKDDPVIRYGEIIGYVNQEVNKGQWIHEKMLYIKEPIKLSKEFGKSINFKESYRFKDHLPIKDRFFLGYRNKDGTVGTKNMLAIGMTVQCAEGVVNAAVEKIKKELLPKYQNVDDVVALNHLYGCGVAINAKNSEIPKRTIRNLMDNPNFGNERLIVSLGCEKFTPEDALDICNIHDKDNILVLQEYNGFSSMIAAICKKAEKILQKLNLRKREKCPVSELVVGLQCGGSDALSGVTANPAIGYAADLLVLSGAKVMFSEVTEVRDAAHLLLKRIKDLSVREKLIDELLWYDNYLDEGEVDRSANPSPGNKKGGLATIIEKALGSIAKSGTSEIVDVISPGEKIRKSGLTYAATPANDFVCGTQQLASGMTLEVFSTGRGTTYNLRQAPVIKVSTNNNLSNKWFDLIDVNAGTIASGEKTIKEVGEEIYELIIKVASGEVKTCADKYQLYNQLAVFNPAPIT